jgi:hypothetical protein
MVFCLVNVFTYKLRKVWVFMGTFCYKYLRQSCSNVYVAGNVSAIIRLWLRIAKSNAHRLVRHSVIVQRFLMHFGVVEVL